jgi:hypothetical protein
MHRPFGIKATAIYAASYGLICLFVGSLLLWLAALSTDQLKSFSTVKGAEAIIYGCYLFITFYGVWSLKHWGRRMMIWFSVFSIALALISLVLYWHELKIYPLYILFFLSNIGLSLIIIFYLSKAQTRKLFTRL